MSPEAAIVRPARRSNKQEKGAKQRNVPLMGIDRRHDNGEE